MTSDTQAGVIAGKLEERARIVAWLRAAQPKGGDRPSWKARLWFILAAMVCPKQIPLIVFALCAEAIERGEHLKGAGE